MTPMAKDIALQSHLDHGPKPTLVFLGRAKPTLVFFLRYLESTWGIDMTAQAGSAGTYKSANDVGLVL